MSIASRFSFKNQGSREHAALSKLKAMSCVNTAPKERQMA
jgi:hypothetical protein